MAACLCCCFNCFNNALSHIVLNYYFDFYLRQEIDDVFGAAIEFGMTFLATKTLGFKNCNALNANLMQSFFHFI